MNKQNKIKNLNEDYIKMIEKISIEKGYNITFDTLIKDTNKEIILGMITTNDDRVDIKTDKMEKVVKSFIRKNKKLLRVYELDEFISDLSGYLFGNKDFINSLSIKNVKHSKSVIKLIKRFLNMFTKKGKYKNFICNFELIWREAHKNVSIEQSISTLKESKFSKGKLISGENIIISDDINGSHPSRKKVEKNLKLMFGIKYFILNNNTEISVENKDIKKYLNDGYHNQKNMNLKKRISGNYGEILENAQINHRKFKQNYKGTNRGKQGFDYYDINLAYPIKDNSGNIIDYKLYGARVVIRKDDNNNFAYDLDNFKVKKGAVLDKTSLSIVADKSADGSLTENNIPHSTVKVNSDTFKYSMQENEKIH